MSSHRYIHSFERFSKYILRAFAYFPGIVMLYLALNKRACLSRLFIISILSSFAVGSITLDGSGSSDPNGSASSCLWTKDLDTGSTVTPGISLPPPAGYTLTFWTGYDTQADMHYGGNGQYGNGTISTTLYKTGPGSFYSRPLNVSNGTRSEVQYTDAAQNPTEGAIEYDVMYEVIIPDNGCSIQWHPNTPRSSGSPYLMHEDGKFTWMNWKDGGNTAHTTRVTIQTLRWYHMRMEYKFGSAGYWKHYIDGVLVCSWTGQVGDGSGQYLKLGYNGWDTNSANSRIYYDNLKIYKKQ